MTRYVAIVDGKPGAFSVVIPDLPGCVSGGPTVDGALRNAVEAITLWAEDARAGGEKIPKPRTAEKLRADPDVRDALAQGGILAYVPLVLDAGRPVKANLSLDAGLLNAIDEAAESRGLTRSAFLASAAPQRSRAKAEFNFYFRFASILSQISAAMSAPPKFFTERIPVGEVTLISVR
jgi:predicted RNase H-like HicB family nuclease